uniref:Receptor kinase-like protein Xa21 n=1 Tax=Oryza punctata TaxID=4537 RepID=A0A0E0MEF6_ORYPU
MSPVVVLLLLQYVLQPTPFSLAEASTTTFENKTMTDRDALLEFKANLGNQPAALSSWNTTSDLCSWPGVTCSLRNKHRVLALNLSSTGLVGTISPSIGNLTFLRILDLSTNALYGEIPSTIGSLGRLQYLNFTDNSLHGRIPESLGNCSGLINIMLDKNQLTGEIPSWLGSFSNLVAMLLSKNNLTGIIPPSLGNISSLDGLFLDNNKLEGTIPEELGRLHNIHWFALYANHLSGTIPETVFNLSSVVGFGVDQNDLHGTLPTNWGDNLPNLIFVFLGLNHFTGGVPATLANATNLHTLDIGTNNFTGRIPPVIGTLCLGILSLEENRLEASSLQGWEFITLLTNCSRLRVLNAYDNMLADELPTCVTNLSTKLQRLSLEYNEISGKIPPDIGNLVGLQILNLSHNHFVGDLPSSIGRLEELRSLGLDGNVLSGSLPYSLGNLTELQVIKFDNNNFEGHLPVSFGNLKKLAAAYLSNNAFTGPFPTELFNISSLSYILDLSDNQLSGPLPPEVAILTMLSYLRVSRNNLSGPLPDEISKCQSLVELHLDGNSFSGSLPASISKMRGLLVLNLTQNMLSGELPPEFGRMEGLEELYLAHNNLSGQIPVALQNMTSLHQLDISYNHLSGQVPENGVFAELTGFLFAGNERLCGGIKELHFPPCRVQSGKRGGMKHRVIILKAIIPVGCLFCLILVFLFFYSRKKRGHHLPTTMAPQSAVSLMGDKYPRVPYAELFQGTDGFAAANLIGRGRYGYVYKGRLSLKDGETVVAVKVFDLEQSGSSKSFLAECKALSKIRHRNLINVITCCCSSDTRQNDFKALVFEFMPNQSLDRWLHNQHPDSDVSRHISGLTLVQRLNIAVDVANALDYLHNNCEPPIVHCDLKPSNILLNEDFVACVGDFGLAKILSSSGSEKSINSKSSTGIRGTIGYVAPEYGEGGQVSSCGDVFSFGVVLLEMFTGKSPTHGMFVDGLTIQSYVEMALPERLTEIVDPVLLFTTRKNCASSSQLGGSDSEEGEISNVINSVIRLALSSSKLTPSQRICTREAADNMRKIRARYLEKLNLIGQITHENAC